MAAMAACPARSDPSSPEGAYQAFVAATRRHDTASAYALLSSATRAVAAERSRAVSAASGGAIKDDPAAVLLQSGIRPEAGAVKVVALDGGVASLVVETPSGRSPVTLVREDGGWHLDLVQQLRGTQAP
jgi:hypothetical protein